MTSNEVELSQRDRARPHVSGKSCYLTVDNDHLTKFWWIMPFLHAAGNFLILNLTSRRQWKRYFKNLAMLDFWDRLSRSHAVDRVRTRQWERYFKGCNVDRKLGREQSFNVHECSNVQLVTVEDGAVMYRNSQNVDVCTYPLGIEMS